MFSSDKCQLVFISVLCTITAVSEAQTVEDKPKVYFGYTEQTVPIVRSKDDIDIEEDISGNLLRDSFCGALHLHLSKKYSLIGNKSIAYDDRANRFASGNVDEDSYYDYPGIECGPYTITIERVGKLALDPNTAGKRLFGKLSIPYYTSGFALLSKSEDIEEIGDFVLGSEKPKDEIRFGVIGKTTSIEILKKLIGDRGSIADVGSRSNAIERVLSEKTEKIEAFGSDRLLIEGFLYDEIIYKKINPDSSFKSLAHAGFGLGATDYSSEPYGVIVYENPSDEKDFKFHEAKEGSLIYDVNSFIRSKAGRYAISKIDDYISVQRQKHIDYLGSVEKEKEGLMQKLENMINKAGSLLPFWGLFAGLGVAAAIFLLYKAFSWVFYRMFPSRRFRHTLVLAPGSDSSKITQFLRPDVETIESPSSLDEDDGEANEYFQQIRKSTATAFGKKAVDGVIYFGEQAVKEIASDSKT